MKIRDLLQENTIPFELEDKTLRSILSYFLHLAPSISSRLAGVFPPKTLSDIWSDFKTRSNISKEMGKIYAPGQIEEKQLKKYHLNVDSELGRKKQGYICYRKNTKEKDVECLLRHMRNAIAHGNVYIKNVGNRKYILFEDYNTKNLMTARILFTQTTLKNLQNVIKGK